jgi:opacity protein-like surface antigen
MSAGDGCSPPARPARQDGVVLRQLSEITGLARSTIGRGLKDLDAAPLPKGRERRKGGGRRHLSSRQSGWTAGGGIEYAFVPNWSIKLEYLHYGLGGVTFSGLTNSANLDIETVKVGVNYLFH